MSTKQKEPIIFRWCTWPNERILSLKIESSESYFRFKGLLTFSKVKKVQPYETSKGSHTSHQFLLARELLRIGKIKRVSFDYGNIEILLFTPHEFDQATDLIEKMIRQTFPSFRIDIFGPSY